MESDHSELKTIMKDYGAIEHSKEISPEEKAKKEAEAETTKKTKRKSRDILHNKGATNLTQAEEKQSGLVSWRIYWYYVNGGGR
jgi:hypothetical protein